MAKSKALVPIKQPEAVPAPLDELGVSGLRRTGKRGLVIEEFLGELSGERGRRMYREMRDNDPVVGAMMFAIEMLARNVDWRVKGEDKQQVEFVEECLDDMSHTWEDFITEALSMLTYGFAWHEIVYKRRQGENRDASKNSRFSDGKIGWRKLPIRSQDSLLEWMWDDEGGVQFFVQSAPPLYQRVEIPIERSLLFRVGLHKANPEGRSLLRNAYKSYYFKKRIEEIEAIGVERDLAGLPVIYRTKEIATLYDNVLKDILKNIHRDEQEGLLLPLAFDDKGNKLLTFELLSASGKRQLDVGGIIDRYNRSIAMTVLADFILLGSNAAGSYALATSKTAMFARGLGAVLKSIASVMNRVAIPRLLRVNGWDTQKAPQLVPGKIETPDLKELGTFITALAGAGAPLFPDPELEKYLLTLADLPFDENKQQAMVPQPTPLPRRAPPDSGIPPAQQNGEQNAQQPAEPPKPTAKATRKRR